MATVEPVAGSDEPTSEQSAPGSAAPTASAAGGAAPSASPSQSAAAAPTALASASSAPATDAPLRLAPLEPSDPEFSNGEVPKAGGALAKLSPKLEACVNDNGGLLAPQGHVKIQFLVRLSAIAEGASVLEAKGISPAAKRCLVDAIQRRSVGTPTADPVGVTVTLSLRAKPEGSK